MPNPARTSDVIVIGGGIVGLATAYKLGKAGIGVTVLERGLCGREASWAGAGVLQCGNWHRTDPLVQLLRESIRNYHKFTDQLREQTGIDAQFERCGSLDLLLEDQQYRMAASEVKAAEVYNEEYGRPVLELLSPEQARQMEPNITADLLGAKYCSTTCQVQNPLIMRALREACLMEKVQIHENCAALELLRQGQRVIGARGVGGEFTSQHVVLTAGPWSSLIDKQLGQLMPVNPVRGQIVLLEMHPRPFKRVIERGRCYLIPRFDGRIVVGATQEPEVGYERRNTVEGVHHLLTLTQRLVPPLAGASIVRLWSGLRPASPDDWPYIGP
ncbi:MAG: NAD(P)/FAD-dependent oxidoreductase, partial [Planctomycetota bacterium]